jgi:putative thioredoxin
VNWNNQNWGMQPVSVTPTATPAKPAPGTRGAAPAPAPAAPPMELVFDVSEADFESQVLERSLQVPVLLDCWAPWCGPCRALGPLLEKLAEAYGGAFVVAKLNTDEAPNISAALRIRSIPLVVLFAGGRMVDQFTGALPEGKLREFLDRHVKPLAGGSALGSPADELLAAAADAPDAEQAEQMLVEALEHEPGHVGATLALAERWVTAGVLDDAASLLDTLPADRRDDRHAALVKRIEIARHKPPGDIAELTARIAAAPKDFEARFALAALLVHAGNYDAAFDQLLEVVLRDKAEGRPDRERARKQLIEWFGICPDAEAVSRGRRYLGMYLN